MLDQSVVHSKGGGARSMHTLNPSAPDLVIDGGSAGATLTVVSGTVLHAPIDNAYQPTGAWAAVAGSQAVAAGVRRAFKQGGPDTAVVSFTFA